MVKKLTGIHKNKYPFRLGTTSFIYPDHYIPNVRLLGPLVDEIELLMFESEPHDAWPSARQVKELGDLAESMNLTYNIHLPLDLVLSSHDRSGRKKAVETIIRIMDLFHPISPVTHTLHLPLDEDLPTPETVERWRERTHHGIGRLLESGIDPGAISIETLDYPFEWVEQIIDEFTLTVCIDIGHLILHEFDWPGVLKKHLHHTSIIHLHGVSEGKDHLSLNCLGRQELTSFLKGIHGFSGSVSLEVFSQDNLASSLIELEKAWESISL